jgi:hypothetical protein
MRGYNCHEEIEIYRTADNLRLKASGDGRPRRGSLPEDWDQPSYLLQLEEKVFRLGNIRLRRLRQLEDENARLKQVVADLTLDKQILQDVLKKKL